MMNDELRRSSSLFIVHHSLLLSSYVCLADGRLIRAPSTMSAKSSRAESLPGFACRRGGLLTCLCFESQLTACRVIVGEHGLAVSHFTFENEPPEGRFNLLLYRSLERPRAVERIIAARTRCVRAASVSSMLIWRSASRERNRSS